MLLTCTKARLVLVMEKNYLSDSIELCYYSASQIIVIIPLNFLNRHQIFIMIAENTKCNNNIIIVKRIKICYTKIIIIIEH